MLAEKRLSSFYVKCKCSDNLAEMWCRCCLSPFYVVDPVHGLGACCPIRAQGWYCAVIHVILVLYKLFVFCVYLTFVLTSFFPYAFFLTYLLPYLFSL